MVQPGLSQMTKHMLLRSHPFYELWRGVRARGDELHLLEKGWSISNGDGWSRHWGGGIYFKEAPSNFILFCLVFLSTQRPLITMKVRLFVLGTCRHSFWPTAAVSWFPVHNLLEQSLYPPLGSTWVYMLLWSFGSNQIPFAISLPSVSSYTTQYIFPVEARNKFRKMPLQRYAMEQFFIIIISYSYYGSTYHEVTRLSLVLYELAESGSSSWALLKAFSTVCSLANYFLFSQPWI